MNKVMEVQRSRRYDALIKRGRSMDLSDPKVWRLRLRRLRRPEISAGGIEAPAMAIEKSPRRSDEAREAKLSGVSVSEESAADLKRAVSVRSYNLLYSR